jgi:hypothetical protein
MIPRSFGRSLRAFVTVSVAGTARFALHGAQCCRDAHPVEIFTVSKPAFRLQIPISRRELSFDTPAGFLFGPSSLSGQSQRSSAFWYRIWYLPELI